ncbi:helix-turn-helix domain-containing protein [Arsenicicoccus piscis]|uniref:HTH cro/C1-type domain-containing protein n=1 Tax=Arsenicicoccus piscis TaxID=673954 RepID=A0ABQ6HSV7_9MICO|nr:helix-turn-helix transcriptional regulator [Arsenicicoccus piscis]MCH8627891.1 helix-turn-helix domain-containing protein [Arsenicicoccus piscis]GMA20789.1 hypothetical protein GCM10025862_28100 [Arsenicicoccus piscis]
MGKLTGGLPVPDLGVYLREQREAAQLSLRQLAELAGVSNPYLSQIERGLRRPSAEILGALAKGLEISAESLYVRAGLLDEQPAQSSVSPDVVAAIRADPRLGDDQRKALLDLYALFTGGGSGTSTTKRAPSPTRTAPSTESQ